MKYLVVLYSLHVSCVAIHNDIEVRNIHHILAKQRKLLHKFQKFCPYLLLQKCLSESTIFLLTKIYLLRILVEIENAKQLFLMFIYGTDLNSIPVLGDIKTKLFFMSE